MRTGDTRSAIRGKDYLLIWNQKPERWPAGAPQRVNPENSKELLPMYGVDNKGHHHVDWAFTDIDGSPSKSYIIEKRADQNVVSYFEMTVAKRPEFELYRITDDPFCIDNLSGDIHYYKIENEMREALMAELKKTGDPGVVGPDKDVFDSYQRYGSIREFPKPE